VRGHDGRQLGRGHGDGHEIVAAQLEVGGAHRRDPGGQLDARQVALVAARGRHQLGLRAGAAA
jgi:hypothetical protein